jgi:hypothetical protein
MSIQQTKFSMCTASRLAEFEQWGWSRRECEDVDTAQCLCIWHRLQLVMYHMSIFYTARLKMLSRRDIFKPICVTDF